MQPEDLLKNIENLGSFPVTKDTPEKERKSLNKLKAYGLVQKRNQHSWELTAEGYLAIEKGGFKNFLNSLNQKNTTHHIENYSIINGDKNILNQSQESKTVGNEKKENLWSRIWWLIIIPILIGILLILVEKNVVNF